MVLLKFVPGHRKTRPGPEPYDYEVVADSYAVTRVKLLGERFRGAYQLDKAPDISGEIMAQIEKEELEEKRKEYIKLKKLFEK